jgi:UDP-N-acetylglucosamine:LPS N-acetylglucosamine transferase
MIEEKLLSTDYLLREIYDILNDPKKHKAMSEASLALAKPNATDDFINTIADAGKFKNPKNKRRETMK